MEGGSLGAAGSKRWRARSAIVLTVRRVYSHMYRVPTRARTDRCTVRCTYLFGTVGRYHSA